ncbi:MAG: Gfo/Idh/MocA family oxidoreductase [Pirellulaceae bacterium]|jgi:predicted dehydrogenase|nr:Gfo/Idh/MocA family oxidoreductase [Planctomycetaceae bacterium]HIM28313.1 Gfo/Idh/MocA family oxidoreductase [Planctomycetota bacterium]
MLRVGITGIGFMGWIHWLAYQRISDVEVVAICTRDEKKRNGDWTSIQGNFGPPGEQVDLSETACYETVDQLLADPNIDLVDVCLPPYLHEQITIDACAAGKHVFCEKPMALTDEACQRMLAAGESNGVQVFVGQVLPFFPEYKFVYENGLEKGDFGDLLGGHFKRIISDPEWLTDFYDPERVGGPLVDLHVHDAHFIRLIAGRQPTSVASQGRMKGDVAQYCASLYHFADSPLVISATSGVTMQQGRSFTHGFEIHFERATLLYDFSVLGGEPALAQPLTVLHENGSVEQPQLGGDPVDAFVAEIAEIARALSTGEPSPILHGSLARDAIQLCHAQNRSVQTGQVVNLQ